MLKGLFKTKKIKNTNNKMARNTYVSTIESKNKINKKNRKRIIYTENILMIARWEGRSGKV